MPNLTSLNRKPPTADQQEKTNKKLADMQQRKKELTQAKKDGKSLDVLVEISTRGIDIDAMTAQARKAPRSGSYREWYLNTQAQLSGKLRNANDK